MSRTRFSVRRIGPAVVLCAATAGRAPQLTTLRSDIAAALGTELFVTALSTLPADEAAARARELLTAAAAFIPPDPINTKETS